MSEDKIYVKIPYSLKDEIKKIEGTSYDKEQKSWYITDSSLLPEFEKVYLKVSYEEKQRVKEMGGMWCTYEKRWYTLQFNRALINAL